MNWWNHAKAKKHPSPIDNPNFRAWFGQSKVVDAHGMPLIVYKGMYAHDYTQENKETKEPGPLIDSINRKTPFPSFDRDDQVPVNLAGFFTDDPSVAAHFQTLSGRGAMYAVYLSIQTPAVFDAQGKPAGTVQFGPEGRPFRDAIRSGKYDGVIIYNTSDEGNLFIPLKPNQIKSATANIGNYDPLSPLLVANTV